MPLIPASGTHDLIYETHKETEFTSRQQQKFTNKSDGKRRNTLGCIDQYSRNMLRLWNSRDRETV